MTSSGTGFPDGRSTSLQRPGPELTAPGSFGQRDSPNGLYKTDLIHLIRVAGFRMECHHDGDHVTKPKGCFIFTPRKGYLAARQASATSEASARAAADSEGPTLT
jgi:hypothetical protein